MDYRVQQAIALIRDGSQKNLSVALLARNVGLSSSRFHHLFKAETGRSPAQYLHDFRMEQARVLLERTQLTIEQILIRFGIKDRSHFEREFKKSYGLTPTQYRMAARLQGSAPAVNVSLTRYNVLIRRSGPTEAPKVSKVEKGETEKLFTCRKTFS